MSVILYLGTVLAALYWVAKIIMPEMAKPPIPSQPKVIPQYNPPENLQTAEPNRRLEKLEILLAEKNKNIQLLQTELSIFIVQVREFDKLRNILEEEIHRLREQNRIFRSELGLPSTQVKESSTV